MSVHQVGELVPVDDQVTVEGVFADSGSAAMCGELFHVDAPVQGGTVAAGQLVRPFQFTGLHQSGHG